MRTWQVERRKRTRHLIELGGLVVKAGVVDLTSDDRATILGALLWCADKLNSDQGERATGALGREGETGVGGGAGNTQGDRSNCSTGSSLMRNDNISAERLRAGSGINRSRSKREQRYAQIEPLRAGEASRERHPLKVRRHARGFGSRGGGVTRAGRHHSNGSLPTISIPNPERPLYS